MSTSEITYFNGANMPGPKVPLSHGALAADGWLYVSGMVPRTPDGQIIEDDTKRATLQCLENFLEVVETAGGTREDIVKTNVYLADFADYGAMNQAYVAFFGTAFPARTTIQAGALGIGAVEIDGTAYRSSWQPAAGR
jgi:enamine deaminase RidA (YjgF/YER057c/UK114 family)